jgi:hypothetical protein
MKWVLVHLQSGTYIRLPAQRSLTNNEYDTLIRCLENRFTPQHVLQEPNKEANRVAKNQRIQPAPASEQIFQMHWFWTPSHQNSREVEGNQRTRANIEQQEETRPAHTSRALSTERRPGRLELFPAPLPERPGAARPRRIRRRPSPPPARRPGHVGIRVAASSCSGLPANHAYRGPQAMLALPQMLHLHSPIVSDSRDGLGIRWLRRPELFGSR